MEAMLFLLGFAAVTGVYEVAKTGKKNKSTKLEKLSEKVIKRDK